MHRAKFVISVGGAVWFCCVMAQDAHMLSSDEAKQFILAKPFTVAREGGERTIRFEFRADGTVFQRTERTSGPPVSSSGTWHLNEKNGKVCVEFAEANTRGVCFGLIQDGVVRLYTGNQSEPSIWGTVK
ncbi:MAG TPA: hypothetical protein VH041_14700 [Caldimonas sp.]|jgi:hypothetical protein|nr:hypothetical protein [Caldimonas sp.]HEX4235542.1 hypothetical protein [Caldimonas sp.]